jgi:hypothetical protein
MCTFPSLLIHARRDPPEGIGEIAKGISEASSSLLTTVPPTSTSVTRMLLAETAHAPPSSPAATGLPLVPESVAPLAELPLLAELPPLAETLPLFAAPLPLLPEPPLAPALAAPLLAPEPPSDVSVAVPELPQPVRARDHASPTAAARSKRLSMVGRGSLRDGMLFTRSCARETVRGRYLVVNAMLTSTAAPPVRVPAT